MQSSPTKKHRRRAHSVFTCFDPELRLVGRSFVFVALIAFLICHNDHRLRWKSDDTWSRRRATVETTATRTKRVSFKSTSALNGRVVRLGSRYSQSFRKPINALLERKDPLAFVNSPGNIRGVGINGVPSRLSGRIDREKVSVNYSLAESSHTVSVSSPNSFSPPTAIHRDSDCCYELPETVTNACHAYRKTER